MEKTAQMGKNRTGMDMSPMHSKAMISGTQQYQSVSDADRQSMALIGKEYIREADPLGSVPVPGTLRGALKSGMEKLTGHNPEVFLNKLGERLAYERTGVRLYESVITKCEAADEMHSAGPVAVDELRRIRNDEANHFRMLKEAMESMGADPTAQTPDADVSGVAAMGIQHVLNDPRTSMAQSLEMLLTLELTDNAAWEMLIKLAEDLGLDELADRFQEALAQEEEHLQIVRSWYETMVMSEAGKSSAAARH
ncbi:MAG: ferritin-like domain-containing protein [Woeseia sp.]